MSIVILIAFLLTGIGVLLVATLNRLEHIAKTLDRIDERGGVL